MFPLPQIFIRVNTDSDEVELERSRTREKLPARYFRIECAREEVRNVDAVLNG